MQNVVDSLNTRYNKCGFRMLLEAGHMIMTATDPRMYEYFPANDKILHLNMIGATTFMVAKTPQSLKVLEKVVKCAFIEKCMAPPNSTTSCVAKKLSKGEYGKCHRYDQSALALSLAQCSSNIGDYYAPSDRVHVKRVWLNRAKDWVDIKKMFPWMNVTV